MPHYIPDSVRDLAGRSFYLPMCMEPDKIRIELVRRHGAQGLSMEQAIWNFEQEPWKEEPPYETSIHLRTPVDRMAGENGNFRADGALIASCERDVESGEARRYRDRARPLLAASNR